MNNLKDIAIVSSPKDLGAVARLARENSGSSLQVASGSNAFGIRFLSEFERGKPTAQIGKVMEALHAVGLDIAVVPRQTKQTSAPLSEKLKLEFPYDWSNPNISESTFILLVFEKARFNDLLAITHYFGIERIEAELEAFSSEAQTQLIHKYLSRIKKGMRLAGKLIE